MDWKKRFRVMVCGLLFACGHKKKKKKPFPNEIVRHTCSARGELVIGDEGLAAKTAEKT